MTTTIKLEARPKLTRSNGDSAFSQRTASRRVSAEYVLRWLEPGTHRWEQFVTPLELTGFARAAGLRRQSLRGMVYDPFRRDWRLSSDTGVNYLFAATKPDV